MLYISNTEQLLQVLCVSFQSKHAILLLGNWKYDAEVVTLASKYDGVLGNSAGFQCHTNLKILPSVI